MPSRVLLQDFTGVPAVVDLAAMRDAMKALGGDPTLINPLQPAELVIDHSVQVDEFGTPQALQLNAELEFSRNKERYAFLRWGQTAFKNFAIVPPDTGIVHQINLEYLARVVFVGANGESGKPLAYPDTLVGTDSHTTMINGLGVLGWGVGGIEAEAAMLGQPVSMLIPQVVGVRLKQPAARRLDRHRPRADRHRDAAQARRGRQVRRILRPWTAQPAAGRSRHHRQHGARIRRHLRHLPRRRRDAALSAPQRPHRRAQSSSSRLIARSRDCSTTSDTPEAEYTDVLELDLATVEPSIAGPKRPQDRVALSSSGRIVRAGAAQLAEARPAGSAEAGRALGGEGGIPPAWTRSRTRSRSTFS